MHCLNELTDLQDIRTLEDLAALHGQQEAETDYVEGSRNLDLRSFDLEGWLSLVATDETERAWASAHGHCHERPGGGQGTLLRGIHDSISCYHAATRAAGRLAL
jgi:hypothetical protein